MKFTKVINESNRRNNEFNGWLGLSPAAAALAALLAAFLPVAPLLHAQTGSGQPERAVRLSYVDGKVSITQDNKVVTDQAVANTPLFEGMTLTTPEDGRAEVQFEDGSVARISPDTSLTLSVLRGQGTSAEAQMDLEKGLAYFELQGNGQSGQMSVHFGDNTVTTSGFTILRVKDDNPPGDLAVFSGNAHLESSSGLALDVHSGESVSLSATDPNGYNLAQTIEPDSWDTWNSDRDQALNAEASAQTSAPADLTGGQDNSPNNPAWSDLDASGSWYNVPDQGYVWSPYDAANAGFDPYGNGSWTWSPGFGYTWASAYSWGYLPYQCGAWNYYNGFGWGWAPGFGGCTPWWGAGFYRGPVIGFAPGWYRPIHRPIGPVGPVRPGRPVPVIPVNRRPQVLTAGLPARNLGSPVSINGHAVTALRSMPVQSTYERTSYGIRSPYGAPVRSGFAESAGMRPGFTSSRPVYTHPAGNAFGFTGSHAGAYQRTYTPAQQHTYTPQRSYTPQRNYTPQRSYTPPSHYSAPPPRSYSPPPSYHPSGGGGGGGHPSGGSGHR